MQHDDKKADVGKEVGEVILSIVKQAMDLQSRVDDDGGQAGEGEGPRASSTEQKLPGCSEIENCSEDLASEGVRGRAGAAARRVQGTRPHPSGGVLSNPSAAK